MSAFAFIAGAGIFCARAQGSGGTGASSSSGQPIVFSAPQDGAPANSPSVAPQTDHLSTMPQSPQLFTRPVTPLRMPQEVQRPQKQQPQDLNNWTLMTPAEILGVDDPDKVFKSPEQQAYDKQHEGQTPVERFLNRQTAAQAADTNGAPGSGGNWDFSRSREQQDSFEERSRPVLDKDRQTTADYLRSSINEWAVNPARNSDPDSSGNSQTLPSSPASVEQAAAMARFEQLLAPDNQEQSAKPALKSFSAIQPQPDPNLDPLPQINPAGASYKPLESGIVRPAGIKPLPTLTDSGVAPPVATPSWAPKPAPWLSQTPQPFAIPQRQF